MQCAILKRILEQKNVTTEKKGEIKINGNIWSAKSEDSSSIPENSQCEILRIEGVTAIVKIINKSE